MPFEIDFEDPRIGFASAHFIIGHDKCGRLHGHNYFIKVKVIGDLDEQHMILDFGELKGVLRKLTNPFDHKVLVPTEAPELKLKEKGESYEIVTCNKRYLIPKEDTELVPVPATTAEEMAKYFHHELKKIWSDLKFQVTIEEAPGASATYSD